MIIAALLSSAIVLTPAPTASASVVRVHDVEADYVRKVAADGTIILSGRENRGGQPFRYTIKDGIVRGWVGTRWVKFPLSEAKIARP